MYRLTTEASFDSAHFLAGYKGKCANLHGHRWRVVVTVKSEELKTDEQERGMCVDFSDIKDDLKELTDSYDHTFIYEKGSLKESSIAAFLDEGFKMTEVDFRPTAENFSKHFYDVLKEKGYNMSSVSVYETPNNCASYSEDNVK